MLLAGMLSMFALAGALVIFFLIYTRRLTQEQLRLKQAELTFERKLLSNTLATQETERKRFARDLHDDLGGSLLTIMLNVAQLEIRSDDPEYIQRQSAQAHEQLNQVLQHLRMVSYDLVPPTLEEFGLVATLEDLVARIQETELLSIRLDRNGTFPQLDYTSSIAAYRMVKELISNTLKHAKAKQLVIFLKAMPEAITITVSDDGCGFEFDEAHTGAGLQNLEARSRQIGAELEVKSLPGKGTKVTILLPIIYQNHA